MVVWFDIQYKMFKCDVGQGVIHKSREHFLGGGSKCSGDHMGKGPGLRYVYVNTKNRAVSVPRAVFLSILILTLEMCSECSCLLIGSLTRKSQVRLDLTFTKC